MKEQELNVLRRTCEGVFKFYVGIIGMVALSTITHLYSAFKADMLFFNDFTMYWEQGLNGCLLSLIVSVPIEFFIKYKISHCGYLSDEEVEEWKKKYLEPITKCSGILLVLGYIYSITSYVLELM